MNSLGKGILAVVLSGAMAVGLAGCGGGGGEERTETAAGKEFVYVPEYVQMELEEDSELNSNQVVFEGDTLYFSGGYQDKETEKYKSALYKLKVGEAKPQKINADFGENSSVSNFVVDGEGNLYLCVYTYEMEMPEGQAGEAAEDKEAAGEDDSTAATEDDPAAEEDSTAAEGEDTGEAAAEREAGGEDAASGESEVAVVKGEDVSYSQSLQVVKMDKDGNQTTAFSLDEMLKDLERSYVQYMSLDKEGNLYFALEQQVYVVNQEGELLFSVDCGGWINSMGKAKDGTVLVSCYGNSGPEIKAIDVKTKALGEALPKLTEGEGMFIGGGVTFGGSGGEGDFLYSMDNKVYSYDMAQGKGTELFSWLDADINSDMVNGFFGLEDGRIAAIISDWGSSLTETEEAGRRTMELAYLTKTKSSEVPEKKILTLGTMYINGDLKTRIINFNKTNPDYRIEVKDYGSNADPEQARKQLSNDIVSGRCPDILDVNNGGTLSPQLLMSKGILEDLNPYLDGDEELKRDDYLENVLNSFCVDGKMYGVSPSYYISTVLAKTSEMKGKTGWTLDEMMEYVDSKPEGTEVMEYTSNVSILSTLLMLNMDKYVDWSTGKCSFNTEEFIKVLEFCSKFPPMDEMRYDDQGPNTHDKLQEGKLLLVSTGFNDMGSYQMYKQIFGEPVTFIGYPTDEGNGSYITAAEMLGMSASSEYKDGVWQFLRTGLTKEYQSRAGQPDSRWWYGFPVMKSALEAHFAEAMRAQYHEGPNGEQIEDPKMTYSFPGNYTVDIYAATQEEVDEMRGLIESTTEGYYFDNEIFNIIDEESASYFQGQKNVKDVADIIQSRVQIYVSENS